MGCCVGEDRFSLWAVIFVFVLCYTIYQILPSGGLDDYHVARIRLPVIVFEILNTTWLFFFGNNRYWPALLVIIAFDAMLFLAMYRVPMDYISPNVPFTLAKRLVVCTPFSLCAGWVTAAIVGGLQITLVAEGWLPSEDFAIGLLLVAVGIACTVVYNRSDVPYATSTVWALSAVSTQQAADSIFGCKSRICAACAQAVDIAICERESTVKDSWMGRAQPNGWKDYCADWDSSQPDVCGLVERSPAVAEWARWGIAIVLVALAAGVVRAYVAPLAALARPQELSLEAVTQKSKRATMDASSEAHSTVPEPTPSSNSVL
jgi:hypothetical protein